MPPKTALKDHPPTRPGRPAGREAGLPRLFVALFLVSLALSSCAKREVAAPPGPVLPPVPRERVSVDVLKKSFAFSGVETAKARVSGRVLRKGEHLGSFKGVFAFRSPDSLWLRLYDPLGFRVLEMVSTGGVLEVYIPRDDAIYEGRAPRLLRPPEGMYAVEAAPGRYVFYAFTRSAGGDLLLLGKYGFNPVTLKQASAVVYRGGAQFMQAMFDAYRGDVPTFVRFSFPGSFTLELTLKEPEEGVELPEKYFKPFSPEGKTVLPLELLTRVPELR
jgi:hypothetical protein